MTVTRWYSISRLTFIFPTSTRAKSSATIPLVTELRFLNAECSTSFLVCMIPDRTTAKSSAIMPLVTVFRLPKFSASITLSKFWFQGIGVYPVKASQCGWGGGWNEKDSIKCEYWLAEVSKSFCSHFPSNSSSTNCKYYIDVNFIYSAEMKISPRNFKGTHFSIYFTIERIIFSIERKFIVILPTVPWAKRKNVPCARHFAKTSLGSTDWCITYNLNKLQVLFYYDPKVVKVFTICDKKFKP